MASARSGRVRRAPARAAARMAAGVLAVLVPGCGGGGSVTGPPPPASVTTVVAEGAFDGVSPGGGVAVPSFSMTRMGTLDIRVNWTSPSNNLDIALARSPCTPDQFLALTCSIVGLSESTTAKPETLSLPNTVVGTYRLFVSHRGTTVESITYRVELTSP